MSRHLEPSAALDLLLALRPEDLDDDEQAELLAHAEQTEHRDSIEAEDALLGEWIEAWSQEPSLGERVDLSHLTGASILSREPTSFPIEGEEHPAPDERPASPGAVERPASASGGHAGPATGGRFPSWLVPAALAAGLALSVVGVQGAMQPSDTHTDVRAKSLVGDEAASRVVLQFSVEGADGRVTPGRNGEGIGASDSLAFRFDVAGESGWLSLLELRPDGQWSVVYPLDGGAIAVEPGAHALLSERGAPLVYRPDDARPGTLQYVAIVQSEPVDPGRVVPGLLAAGLHRADLWPRPVLAVDAVTVTWESE